MKIKIEFELDIDNWDEGHQHDHIADLTYYMRTDRELVPGTWRIEYR